MIEIKQLTDVSIEEIYTAFSNAFSDYVEPFDLTINQLKHMIERRGCNFHLSFGAFNGNDLVGLTLNGTGDWNGRLTAYDTGTGVIKEFRKKGIATKMFNESLPILRQNGIEQYLLEVICSNTSAFDLYKKAGFKVVRNFDYYNAGKEKLKFKSNSNNADFIIKEIDKPNWELFKSFWDFEPSWQNSIESINRKIEYFIFLGIFERDSLVGYGIIEKSTGDIPQFAMAKKYRRMGLATLLFDSLIRLSETKTIKIINTDADYEPFKKFAENINLQPGIGQYEMLMSL
ncbi:MAG: GNAT family N-acetyltransferase [Melioribacteraceae bacterium]|nr:GNAT family N-acetyltransferase [Melioribacteraceae bacterium]